MADELDDWDFDTFKAEWNSRRKSPFDFDVWSKEIAEHPAFMTCALQDGQYSDALEALQAIKYDTESTIDERATALKTDGNFHFKHRLYRKAILAYTEAIKLGCADQKLVVDLYNNRSAANFYLGNYRSAFNDCLAVRKSDPNHAKSFKRGVDCLLKLNCPLEALKWLDEADPVLLDKIPEIQQTRHSVVERVRNFEKERRRNAIRKSKDEKERRLLFDCFKARNIKLNESPLEKFEELDLQRLEVDLPHCSKIHRVHVDPESGSLIWPVLFLYPEYNTTDFVERFDDNSTFADHFNILLADTPGWDANNDYKPDNIELYYESYQRPDNLVKVLPNVRLRDVLSRDSYHVMKGLPSFIVLPQNTKFQDDYLSRFCVAT